MRSRITTAALLGSGLPIAVAWVALTMSTGKTYHLAPAIVAAAPPYLWRAADRARSRAPLIAGPATGIAAWLVLVAFGQVPSATLVPGQPGGVWPEAALAIALGVAVGAGKGPSAVARAIARLVRGTP